MAEGQRTKVEASKEASNYLRGDLAAELHNDGDGAFTHESYLLLKFHGIYQQDDRDLRRARKAQGLTPAHSCMVRASVPGGALTAAQYLELDKLCDAVGNATMRITSRQGVQFHFVAKSDLPELIAALNSHLVTTLGACGDVVRNTTCCPAPYRDPAHDELRAHVTQVAAHFRPRTPAYYELWLDGEHAVTAHRRPEPLYDAAYLPRKFKIGFAHEGDNCIDVLGNDVAVIPVLSTGTIRAFTLAVGGGMGRSHTRPDTFPRLATPLTTIAPVELLEVLEAIVTLHRDHGDRADRHHARLKYLVDDWGIAAVRAHLSSALGRSLPPPAPITFAAADDHLGWHPQGDGTWFLGIKVESGRLIDRPNSAVRSGIRAAVERYGCNVRLTAREDLLLTDIAQQDRDGVSALLEAHCVAALSDWSPLERASFACPALPTCGLALTESERVLPRVLAEIDDELTNVGLTGLDVEVRMTGCANGCARPYTAEIGLIGRAKDRYDIALGADRLGTRLNVTFAENVPRSQLAAVLSPALATYHRERHTQEAFGDFCARWGVARLRTEVGTEQWTRAPRSAADAP